MTENSIETSGAPKADEKQHDPMRRMMLGAMAGTAGILAGCMNTQAGAQVAAKKPEDDKGDFNAFNRQKTFVNNEMDGTPWIASKKGNFDVNDPEDNRFARLKMTNNLIGKRTYIPMMTRMVIGRDQIPGGRLLGAASMFTWQLQVPDPEEFKDIPEGTALMRSMYTARYLDPETMEPVKSLKNPFNGKMMELEDYIFVENFLTFPKGGSRFVEELQFANDDPEKPRTTLIKPWGDDLILYSGGTYSKPGNHQPRFTENTWRSSTKDVMNPDVNLVETNYNFMGANKAYEKPWAGYTEGADSDMLYSLATGKKVHSAEDLPDFHKRTIAEKYPERL